MKILYAIQGTGNGHICRAMDLIPLFKEGNDVDILISGNQNEVELPWEITYRFSGLGFVFGKNGGIDIFKTFKKAHLRTLFKEISKLPVKDYDLVISDFEPVSAWACYINRVQCIGLSHQLAILHKDAPKPKHKDVLGKAVLKSYAPYTHGIGFHFCRYGKNVYTPIIRKEVRALKITDKGHITVYLPAYGEKRIIKTLSLFSGIKWEVFSKHIKDAIQVENISIRPVTNIDFLESMASSSGVICGAGFETPAEAIYLGKKLLVIPMKNQYEQHYNAAALLDLGIPVLKNFKKKQSGNISQWLNESKPLRIEFPDNAKSVVEHVLGLYQPAGSLLTRRAFKTGEFRSIFLKKLSAKF